MASTFQLAALRRQEAGTSAARRLRRDGLSVPGIIYGAKQDTLSITVSARELNKALENEAFFSHVLTIELEGKKEKAILKGLHRHPYRPAILHVDFLRIDESKKLHMHIPLHFKGQETCPGVLAGGVVSHVMSDVEIACLPKDLPEFIEVDLSHLEMDQSVHLSDLKLPKGVEILALTRFHDAEHNLTVATVHEPRVIEEEPVAVAEEAAAEGATAEEGAAPADAATAAEGADATAKKDNAGKKE